MSTIIKPSASIRKDYNSIANLCKKTKQPIYLTKKGEGDLVVMDIEAFNKREAALNLREKLLTVEEERKSGVPDVPADEVAKMMREAIREAMNV